MAVDLAQIISSLVRAEVRIKEAADRPKDREAIAELRVLLEETEKKNI